jgi:hypothetical protein
LSAIRFSSATGLVLLLSFVAGCTALPPHEPGVEPAGIPSPVTPAAPPPSPPTADSATQSGCELERSTIVSRHGATFEVTAQIRNRTARPIDLELPDRCPLGPASFRGLTNDYDYCDACARGACVPPRANLHAALAPGETSQLQVIEIDPSKSQCNAALEPGKYTLDFDIASSLRQCAGALGHLELTRPRDTPGEAPPKPAAQPPKPTVRCKPGPACGLACPSGRYAHDANGCSVCGCEPDPFSTRPSAVSVPP